MSTNIYMEPSNYASTHYGGGPLPDRQPAFFQGDASHEPRAARPFDSHGSSAGPSDLYAQQPPAPGVLDNHHSPLSSGLPFAEQNAAHPGMSYRPHSPGSSSITSSPGYRGSFSHHQIPGMAHQRHDSISSLSSPHDVGGPWAPSSPALGGGPPSRHASIYSLNGHFDQVGINNTPSLDGSSSQHTTGTTSGHMYEQSPPLPAQIRYAQAAQAIDARRFSLDERQIRSQPQAMKGSSGDLQTSSGRHWPWGTGASGIHGRHASVSAAPQQSSYEYSQQTRTPYGHTAASGFHSYDPSQASPLSPQRYRSMSSSAISGRQYPYPYGSPGTAAHAAAAMGYGMAPHMGPGGMLMDGEIPEGPGPARRAKFKRSRTGCLVCRKRKVKCSQDGTPCKQCRIGKRDCHYEDQPQKKKTKKDKAAAAAAAATTTSAGAPASSSNGAPADGSEKNSSNGASQGGSAASGSGGMASQGLVP
ncbi:hypothetical protein IE53DRAFT_200766 [Violaceomyces palustris]|uniref:Uncharacterized protein n=1 Tax=Violaceomyces palustris TaxID=1673888 RepID=A0ACD0NRI3_9BASI|nr:hypothetical protein IE53DRAFT_200766 [Violaceomyces palustris]